VSVRVPLWWPLHWSSTHGYAPIPFEGWVAWHYANLLPRSE
jgi:hypothetical protein